MYINNMNHNQYFTENKNNLLMFDFTVKLVITNI